MYFFLVFVTHGGIGPSTNNLTISELNKLNRFKEPSFEIDQKYEEEEKRLLEIENREKGIVVNEVVKEKEFVSWGMGELLWSGE